MINDTMEMGDVEFYYTHFHHLIANMQTDIKNKKQKEMETNLEAEDDEAI
jgi:hypothetical protein